MKFSFDFPTQNYELFYERCTRILRENILSQSAMQKLRKGEMIGIKTLEQLCELLDMQPGNIIKYVENKPKKI